MNRLDNYTEFLKITIHHEYFNGIVPVDLDVEDASIEKKYGIRIRRSGNCWIFYGREPQQEDFTNEFKSVHLKFNSLVEKPADKRMRIEEERRKAEALEKLPVEEPPLSFNLVVKPRTSLFYYVTSSVKTPSGAEAVIFGQKGVELPIEEITLRFIAASKYFEYIFLTKSDPLKLNIEEVNGLIDFRQLPDRDSNHEIRFISKTPIALSSTYNYQMNLIEQTKYGNRIVLNAMKIPDPASISKEQPYQTITAYYTI